MRIAPVELTSSFRIQHSAFRIRLQAREAGERP